MRVIFKDRCGLVHILFVGMVKFKFLANFPVDHLAHPVVSSLVLLLFQFAAFAYYVVDGFISVTTDSTSLTRFSHQRLLVFHMTLCHRNSPLVTSTLVNILANIDNAVVYIFSIRFPIFSSSSPIPNLWELFQSPQLVTPSLLFQTIT